MSSGFLLKPTEVPDLGDLGDFKLDFLSCRGSVGPEICTESSFLAGDLGCLAAGLAWSESVAGVLAGAVTDLIPLGSLASFRWVSPK